MAANLNKPADFCQAKVKKKNVASMLIPPSAFEKPLALSKSELEKARDEIRALKSENEILRHSHLQATQQTPAAPAATSSQPSHPDYAEELIRRQAREMAEVKAELEACRRTAERDQAEWGRKVKDLEEAQQEERRRMDKLIQYKDEEFEERMSRLSSEYERSIEEAQGEAGNLRDKLESLSSSLGSQVRELEKKLSEAKQDREDTAHKLQEELRQKSQLAEEQSHQINQLKAYIGEQDESQRSGPMWKLEKEALDNRLRLSQAQHQQLRSELELMEVRYTALNDILLVQEAQLSKAKTDGANAKGKQHKLLITSWREKVFELLVQQKSAEITFRNDENAANQRIAGLEENLSSKQAELQMLTHSLSEKEAQLKMETNKREQIEQELAATQQIALTLDSQTQGHVETLERLKEFSLRHQQKSEEMMKALEEKSAQLKVLGQRVSFASSRMGLLKSQLVRSSAISFGLSNNTVANTTNTKNDSKKSMSTSRADEDMSRDSEEHLYQELERVMRERDMLATQVREDSDKWTQRLSQSRSQYTSQIEKMKRTVEDLEFDVQQKSKTCAQLTQELTLIKETMEEKDDTIAQLQAELAKHARGVSAVLTDQRLTDEAAWSEKLATVERKLNESKREHAKAVVSLRQLERSHARETERSANLLHTTEEHLSRQLAMLQAKLEASERDGNIMVATLRQEGLLAKARSERGEPLRLPLESHHARLEDNGGDDEDDDNDDDESRGVRWQEGERYSSGMDSNPEITAQSAASAGDDSEGNRHSKGDKHSSSSNLPHEPVESVLEDLRALTVAIFDDDEEGDESRLEESSDVPSAQVTSDRSDS
ncbi:coiled-coil alpha-helical rod protein 1 [Plakobranchus ocellatus]|uniref:Coiled-coil alpha-helical rod protein 1 n=1 Tax=Plakobranchus ocellatus TaxID=259542 RepID=A0AAV4AVY2_9GAST|nr:coiled-coil alpha-helical rod protein 1 [Plakobranchus ocellatus]